jgi:hypothetical protein
MVYKTQMAEKDLDLYLTELMKIYNLSRAELLKILLTISKYFIGEIVREEKIKK